MRTLFSVRLSFPPSYTNLVHDLNEKARNAGLEPIAVVDDRLEENKGLKDYTDDEKEFSLDLLDKSIKEIRSRKEIKNMEEVANIKEIKSIKQIPDKITEEFIKVVIGWQIEL